jgi:hypothetical protein
MRVQAEQGEARPVVRLVHEHMRQVGPRAGPCCSLHGPKEHAVSGAAVSAHTLHMPQPIIACGCGPLRSTGVACIVRIIIAGLLPPPPLTVASSVLRAYASPSINATSQAIKSLSTRRLRAAALFLCTQACSLPCPPGVCVRSRQPPAWPLVTGPTLSSHIDQLTRQHGTAAQPLGSALAPTLIVRLVKCSTRPTSIPSITALLRPSET